MCDKEVNLALFKDSRPRKPLHFTSHYLSNPISSIWIGLLCSFMIFLTSIESQEWFPPIGSTDTSPLCYCKSFICRRGSRSYKLAFTQLLFTESNSTSLQFCDNFWLPWTYRNFLGHRRPPHVNAVLLQEVNVVPRLQPIECIRPHLFWI